MTGRFLLGIALAALGGAAVAGPLTAEQNGDQKDRYAFTLSGDSLQARSLRTDETRVCADKPSDIPAGTRFEAIGDQHLVVRDASGRPLGYYHAVTDRWFPASAAKGRRTFGPVAWGVLALYFLLMVAMAVHFARKRKTADDYFRGGGRIPWYVAGVSIFATMLSSVTFLSLPAQCYLTDWRYFPMAIGVFLLAPVVIRWYLPFFCRLKITSAYEYLEMRFNLASRLFASGAYVVFMVCRVAIVTLLPALALNAMTGASIDLCVVAFGLLTVAYCVSGGLEAVVWSDFVQGIVLVAGALAIAVTLVAGSDGGLAGAWASASAHGKLRMLDFRFLADEPVFWVVIALGLVENLISYTSDQCVIQRYISVRDERAARKSIWFNGVLCMVVDAVFFVIGTALWTYYRSHPETLDPAMPKADSILPFFMVSGLPPVLSGLVVAALFAATVSTLSANISSAATTLTTDFVVRFRPSLGSDRRLEWGRRFTVLAGLVGVVAALVLAHAEVRSLFDKFKEFISVLTAGLAGLFFLGVFVRRVGGRAALGGLIANYAVCFALRYAPLPFARPHVFLVGGIGLVVCVVTAWLLSFVLPEDLRTRSVRPTGVQSSESGG